MAERVGFEPTIELPLYSISNAAPSTTRPSLRFRLRQSNNILRFQEKIKANPEKKSKKMAERGGFEPDIRVHFSPRHTFRLTFFVFSAVSPMGQTAAVESFGRIRGRGNTDRSFRPRCVLRSRGLRVWGSPLRRSASRSCHAEN